MVFKPITTGYKDSAILAVIWIRSNRLFISLNSNLRYGWSTEFDAKSNQDRKVNEFVITAPELKIGVDF
jgi:hypothetical protein